MIHLVTGEYPPVAGGVADYTQLVARELAERGEMVHVWAPGGAGSAIEQGVVVHRVAGRWGLSDLVCVNRELNRITGPRRIVIQWTPHSFGFRSLNVPFALWVWKRARVDGDRVELMVHEPFLAFSKGRTRQNIAAWVHRAMVVALLDAATQVWVSIPAWAGRLRAWAIGRQPDYQWLPVPANVLLSKSAALGGEPKRMNRCPIVGHFGTFRADIATLLEPALLQLLDASPCRILLIGRSSREFRERFITANARYQDRVAATGDLCPRDAADRLTGCDVLLQPYPDGVSTRRGTAMAALAVGAPMVTNLGALSEPLWRGGAVALAESKQALALTAAVLQMLGSQTARQRVGARAKELYEQRFAVRHTADSLLGLAFQAKKKGKAA